MPVSKPGWLLIISDLDTIQAIISKTEIDNPIIRAIGFLKFQIFLY